MVMVSGAFNHLCDKLTAGEVSNEVLQKLSQLISDLSVRNYASASAIQTVRKCAIIFLIFSFQFQFFAFLFYSFVLFLSEHFMGTFRL